MNSRIVSTRARADQRAGCGLCSKYGQVQPQQVAEHLAAEDRVDAFPVCSTRYWRSQLIPR